MQPSEFIHLHVHSVHSQLDSTITIQSLINKAIALNMPAVAITDYATLNGADEFMRKCYEADIKPIVGCEMFVAEDLKSSFSVKPAYHLVLLCKNRRGFKNISKLVAFANNEGFHHKPCVDKDVLNKHSDGLIALSGCMKGEIACLCLRGKYDEAVVAAKEYLAIFPDNFYIELQESSLAEQKVVNKSLLMIAAELNIPVVATNDCHYLTPDEATEHEKLICEQTGKSISDPTHMRYSTNEFYFKSPEEMNSAFAYAPEAIRNSVAIATKCNVVTLSAMIDDDGKQTKVDFDSMISDVEHNEDYHARWDRIYKAEADGVGAVGIFWILPEMRIEYFSLPYTEGFDEGDYIIAQINHETHWRSVKKAVQSFNNDLNEFAHDYNYFPRGKVVYSKTNNCFIIYGPDVVINDVSSMELIKSTFNIADKVTEIVNC